MTETPVEALHTDAVFNGVLLATSPSQLNLYLDCPRKWWYEKVGKRGKAFAPWLGVGTKLHTEMENYFLHGTLPASPSALLALELDEVPERGPEIYIEAPHDYNTGLFMAGVPVKGRVDFRVGPRGSDSFRILDWKSCKTYAYTQTADALARNPQGIVYLQYGFLVHPEATHGTFGHVYLRTGTEGAKAVVTDRLSRPHVQEVYDELERVVVEMKTAAGAQEPEDIRYNKSACSKYGGCQFRSICPAADGVKRPVSFDMEGLMAPPPSTPSTPVAPISSLSNFLKLYGQRGLGVKTENVKASCIITADAWKGSRDFFGKPDQKAPVIYTHTVRPQDPHLPELFTLVTDLVMDSAINPPDAREPYPVTPWKPRT